MAHAEDDTFEVQKLRIEFQQIVQLGQASFDGAMRNMMAEFKRDDGQSESASTEGTVAAEESPAGARPVP